MPSIFLFVLNFLCSLESIQSNIKIEKYRLIFKKMYQNQKNWYIIKKKLV